MSVAEPSRPPQSRWPRSAVRASVRRARGTPVSCQAVCSARKRSSFLVWAGFWVQGALGLGHGGSLGPPEVSAACPSLPSPSAAPVRAGLRGQRGAGAGAVRAGLRGCRGTGARSPPCPCSDRSGPRGGQAPAPEQFRKLCLEERFCSSAHCFASS